MAAAEFMAKRRENRQIIAPEVGAVQMRIGIEIFQIVSLDADVDDLQLTRERAPGIEKMSGLGAKEVDGEAGGKSCRVRGPGIPVYATRHIHGNDGETRLSDPLKQRGHLVFERAGEARAKHRIDDQIEIGEIGVLEPPD